MIALDLDDPVFDRPAGTAFLLELFGQFFEVLRWQSKPCDEGYPLAFASLGLFAYPDYTVTGIRSICLLAGASSNGLLAARAHLARFCGVNQA